MKSPRNEEKKIAYEACLRCRNMSVVCRQRVNRATWCDAAVGSLRVGLGQVSKQSKSR